MRYLIIIEQGAHNLSAYVPDLTGCVTTGRTRDEIIARMQEALELHLQGMRDDREPIPEPNSDPEWVEVSQPSPVA